MEYVITPQRSGSVSLSSDLFFFFKDMAQPHSQVQERDMAHKRGMAQPWEQD